MSKVLKKQEKILRGLKSKSISALLLVLFLCVSMFSIPIYAELENVAEDTFTAPDNTFLCNYTGGTGFTGKWKDDSTLITDLPSNEYKIINNYFTTVNPIKWGGLSGQRIDVYRALSQPIDLHTDKDYYLKFKMTARNYSGDTYQTIDVGGKFSIGYKRNDTLGVFTYTNFDGTAQLAASSLIPNQSYTFVVYISAKKMNNDSISIRAFNDATETPTYTPDSWDLQISDFRVDNIDYIGMIFKNGSGSGTYPIFDDLSIKSEDTYPASDSENIAQDSYNAPDNTFLCNYVGGTGFTGKWKADRTLTTDLPSNEYKIINNYFTTVNPIKWGGLSGQMIGMFRGVSQPIDLNVDKDYYLSFKMTARNFGGDTFQRVDLGGNFIVGYKRNDSLAAVFPYTNFGGTTQLAANGLVSNQSYTFVVRISALQSGNDILSIKAFNDATETPTYTPSSWDLQVSKARTDIIDYIGMSFKNGSGSGTYPIFDELIIGNNSPKAYNRGVNIAGAEFNASVIPGTVNVNYTFNNEATFGYFAGKGFNIIRVPILWERIQPTLNGTLNTDYLNGLKSNITWAKNHNAKVIIDIHNYGRYKDKVIGVDASVPISSFTNLWVRLSNEFKNETGVYAYDIMNEPHGIGTGANDWKVISQAAVTAIRNNGDNTLIMVEGTSYANAHDWATKNGTDTSWITDPADNFMYSAHCYFDYNASGTYTKTYDEELAANPNLATIGVTRVMDFINWCKDNNVKGYIGEFGIPKDDSRWNTALENFMEVLDYHGLDATYWAGGTWWGSYPLSIQPTNNYTTDAPQMSVLLNHLSQ